MERNRFITPLIIIALLVIVIGGLLVARARTQKGTGNKIRIGIVTDITGPAAYFGESTRVGAEMAKEDLAREGYNVEIVYEDYQLDPKKALTATEKLVGVDKVNGIYAELNPAIYSMTPYLKNLGDNAPLFVYDAAPTSPLKELPNAYKTYFSYEIGCRDLAKKYQAQGIKKMGVLKINMEFGEICNNAIRGVYGENTVTEAYEVGGKDFKTQVLKLKEAGVEAIINAAFEGDTLTAFRAIKEVQWNVLYGTVTDSIGDDTKKAYPEMIQNVTTFGYIDLDADFIERVRRTAGDKVLSTNYPAATAYLHIKQMVRAIDGANGNIREIANRMANVPADNLLGFGGFDRNREAIFRMDIGAVK